MVELKYDNSLEILRMTPKGTIKIEDIIEVYNRILESDIYPKKLNILIDASESRFDVELKQVKKITKIIGKVLSKYSSISEAILIKKPFETVIAIMHQEGVNFENYIIKIFYTEEAALDWLKT